MRPPSTVQFPSSNSGELNSRRLPGGFVSPESLRTLVLGVSEWTPEFGVSGSLGFGATSSPVRATGARRSFV